MNSGVSSGDEYQLGSIIIKGAENTLVTRQGDVVLLPKVMMLLLYFCRNSRRVVTFDELNSAIWPREVVGDNAIYNLVGQLRKALGEKASNPTYIQTVSKVGYRLLLEAKPVESAAPDAGSVAVKLQPDNLLKSEEANQSTHKKPQWYLGILVAVVLVLISAIILLQKPSEPGTPEDRRQLKLAQYQLNRGDNNGIDQALETLQQLLVVAPGWIQPKIELAYGFIRKANSEPENVSFWIAKAKSISQNNVTGKPGIRLAAIIAAIESQQFDLNKLQAHFTQDNVLTSSRLAYSDILFDTGKTDLAAQQIQRALNDCVDCPLVYRKLATAQMVLGNVQEGFESFSQYRMLVNKMSDHPADITGLVPLNLQTLKAMAQWQSQTSLPKDLLPHQRNNLALFYLTLGKINEAKSIVKSTPENATQFFDLYTHAAIAGAEGDFNSSYRLLNKRQMNYPDNQRFKLSVVYALWQLDRFDDAMQAFKEHRILEESTPGTADPLPAEMPYATWSIYADLLIKTGNFEQGELILEKLEEQLTSGIAPGSLGADMRLPAILALQGKKQQALAELERVIEHGWVSDFNQNWWYLQDSPYFKNLRDDDKFQQIVARYHEKLAAEIVLSGTNQLRIKR